MSRKHSLSPDMRVRAEDWILEELDFKDLQDVGELLYPLQWHCAGGICGCCWW